jgi:hypothetical protein
VDHELTSERAKRARDAGLARLRRLTGAAIVVALALAAVFAGVAASSTHPRKLLRRTAGGSERPPVPRIGPEPKLPPPRTPALAAQAPAAPPAPPVAATPVSPPVVVSGSS